MSPRVQVVQAGSSPRQRRRIRRPEHPFNVSYRPFEICPFLIAPVLPNETLDNLLMKAYVVSDPVLNPLIGWWLEKYYFYVPHRALESAKNGGSPIFNDGNLTGIHLDASNTLSSLAELANYTEHYMFKGGIDFVGACLNSVVDAYFRDEGDGGSQTNVIDYPVAYVNQRTWMQSLKLESATGDDVDLPGVDEVEDLDTLAGYTTARDQWEIMRDSGVQDVTYEDYLRAQGVRTGGLSKVSEPEQQIIIPELIRFSRNWKYPTNHIDPTDGSPTSALVWSLADRADKARYFKEPGFIFGVSVARPKMYFSSQKGSLTGLMQQADYWLPQALRGFPYTTVKEALDSATEGVLQNQTEDYWFDVKDLFLYGEQYVNRAFSVTANHGLAIPTATMDKRHVTAAMMKSFFVDAAGTANFVKEDGTVFLHIRSGIGADTTPGPGQP